jgi:hypothetical protein
MPRGSEVCWDICRIGCRSRQRAYHNPCSVVGSLSGSQVPQPPLDSIAGNGIPDRTADDEADAWPVIETHSMDHQRRSTRAHSAPRRTAEVLRATHSQRSRQHGGRSRYQADRRARPLRRRPERIARPARVRIRRRKPWVRLRRRLLGWNVRLVTGKLPHLRSAQQIRYGAHTARIAGGASRWQRPLRSDLLTVRGTAKPVKLDGVGPLKSGSIGDLAPTRTGGIDSDASGASQQTPNLANIADSLARRL